MTELLQRLKERKLVQWAAKQTLRDSGFEKNWRVKGWLRYCRPNGDSDFKRGDCAAKAN